MRAHVFASALVFAVAIVPLPAHQELDRSTLPIREPKRPAYSELDVRDVKARARFEVKAPTGSPNVVIILIDDIGYGVADSFGGPVSMPAFARLASNGLFSEMTYFNGVPEKFVDAARGDRRCDPDVTTIRTSVL